MSRIVDRTVTKHLSEIQIQANAFQEMYNHFPETRGLCFHVPNGGSRNAVEGMQLKAAGVIAGVPDIIFIWKGRAYGFEFKTESGELSKAQEKIHDKWREDGTPVFVIRSSEEFIKHIEKITGLRRKLFSAA